MRVLIVEDQPDVAAVMSALVGQMGHETVVAPAGNDAIRACLRTRPDLVLMDIELPDIDGYELTKRLKSQFDLRNVPVWMVTSLSDNKFKRDAAGMTGYLQKPVSASGLELRASRRRIDFLNRGDPSYPRPSGRSLTLCGQALYFLHLLV